jgi:hypothetical protein
LRVFEVAATFTVNICELTIAHGSVTDGNGGGIANFGALNLISCVLSDNSATGTGSAGLGGGVYSFFGTLTVTSSTLSGNSAGGYGGGIFNDRGTATVTGSTLSGNAAGGPGGGIFSFGPKQSRNLLQSLGLSRYETPIDSRIVKWLNEFGFPLRLSAPALADRHYYAFVMEGFQQICRACEVMPCVLDAAIFASFDNGGWTEESIIW